eukprot:CAMPEP_0174255402 /NCGR_PEP_ID=MMETSP0439-20130205/4745_1 /TAXON_ID=0 /ORGANISM="Stereomyxa ramosa, Strain Chinc5" /LENGTH=284 /DNA_ID=CAMNT_0015337581 /DNA_START=415 /DNA_END=1269 /DNA_ORIENTATION=-
MGMNAYFAFQVVGENGSGKVGYKEALAAVFLEGIVFFLLALFGLRSFVGKFIPEAIRLSTTAGVGMFLAFIGLQYNNGIGLVMHSPSTLVTLGGCEPRYWDPEYEAPTCLSHVLQSGTTWLGICGFFFIAGLMARKFTHAIGVGIVTISILSWFRGTPFTCFGDDEDGELRYEYFKKVVDFHLIEKSGMAMSFNLTEGEVWIALITLLYVDLLDTTGTLYSMAKFAGFMKEDGSFEGQYFAFMIDGIATIIGSMVGISPSTTITESGAGIAVGGRTGTILGKIY